MNSSVAEQKQEYCYSFDEEGFMGHCPSKDSAIAEAIAEWTDRADSEGFDGTEKEIWIGEVVSPSVYLRKMDPWRLTGLLIEHLEECLCDDIGYDDNVICDIPMEEMRLLGAEIMEAVLKRTKFKCYGVGSTSRVLLRKNGDEWDVVPDVPDHHPV